MDDTHSQLGFHYVITGFSKSFGKMKQAFMRRSLVSAGHRPEDADRMIADLKNGIPRHPLQMPSPDEWPTEEQIRATMDQMERAGLAVQACYCQTWGSTGDDGFGLNALREDLKTESRQSALRRLIEAAQTDPAACDILIDDALERNDVLQADHWQSRKHQLKTPSKPPQAATPESSKQSTWMGISHEVEGGDF